MSKFNNIKDKNKILFAAILIVLGILFRTVWHLGDNVEFVTTASLLASVYLGFRYAILVPFLIMMITDLVIGNTNIFIFTWSAYIIIGLFGYIGLGSSKAGFRNRILQVTGMGFTASLWFYIWTNFGVWLLDSGLMYPKTMAGLFDSYILGIPFFKYNLIGNLVLVPTSFILIETCKLFFLNRGYIFHKNKNLIKT